MTPDLSYTTGREGESSARMINGMKNRKESEAAFLLLLCTTIPKQSCTDVGLD